MTEEVSTNPILVLGLICPISLSSHPETHFPSYVHLLPGATLPVPGMPGCGVRLPTSIAYSMGAGNVLYGMFAILLASTATAVLAKAGVSIAL